MKLLKLVLLLCVNIIICTTAISQTQLSTNASLNILSANSGIVTQGGIVDLSISVTNTGANPIVANRIRVQISIPNAIALPIATVSQTALSPNWIVTSNTAGGVITICNNTDVIPAGQTRTSVVKVSGVNIGGPLTINAGLAFGTVASCTGFGSLPGDIPADNTSTTGLTVVASCPLVVSAIAGTINCNGGNTTITATTTGATGVVEYSITGGAPFQSSNIFTVPAGTYTVLARQTNNVNCTAISSSIAISQPLPVPVPNVISINQPTCTVATGSVQLGGLPSGNWTINPGNISGLGVSTIIANLNNGTYNFVVTDATGCSSSPSAPVVINTQPVAPNAPTVGTLTQPTCLSPNGSVVLSGLPSGSWVINPGNASGIGSTITINNLTSGTYNFTVANADGCISSPSANVIFDSVAGIPTAPMVSIVQTTCTNSNAIITVTSPTVGLTFSFDNGAYQAYPAAGFIAGPGNHTLSVRTSSNCISANTTIVVNPQPTTPAAPTVNITQPSCSSATGTVAISSSTTGLVFSVDGGSFAAYPLGGYTLSSGLHSISAQSLNGCTSVQTSFTINAQPVTPPAPILGTVTQPTCILSSGSVVLNNLPAGNWVINPGNISGSSSSFNVTGLASGNYSFTVTNSSGCISSAATIVTINPVAEAPSAPTVIITQPTCTIANGIVVITSVTTGLLFSIDGGSYAPYPSAGYVLPSGTHTILAQNTAFCTSPVTNVIINPQPQTPPAPTVSIIQPNCTITNGVVSVTSITANMLFSLDGATFTNYPTGGYILTTGSHALVAQNADGCLSSVTNIVINSQPAIPTAPVVSILQPTCTVANAVVTITSSTAGLLFSLDGGVFSPYPATGYSLSAGVHTLSAQNGAGCISSPVSIIVNLQPPTPVTPVVNIIQPTCTVANGIVTITSPITGLTFSVDGGGFLPYSSLGYSLTSAVHNMRSQNSFGCVSSAANFTINTQPTSPSGTVTAGTINCNGGSTNLIVAALNGVAPYEYSLDGITFQTQNIFSVVAGTYTVKIKGANGCEVLANTITISQPSSITASTVAGIIDCNGGSTMLTVIASGGTAPLQYSLNGGAFQASNIFTATAGAQTVVVKDANGCTKAANVVTLSQPAILKVNTSAPRILYCGGKTDVTVTATGGTSPYTGLGTFKREAGVYVFTVTDAKGCIATKEIGIEPAGCMELSGYPNPARDFITINHTIAEQGTIMLLYTMQGQKLATVIVPTGNFKSTIDLKRYAAGLYTIVYLNGNDRKSFLFEKIN
jgi:large repetitive protein